MAVNASTSPPKDPLRTLSPTATPAPAPAPLGEASDSRRRAPRSPIAADCEAEWDSVSATGGRRSEEAALGELSKPRATEPGVARSCLVDFDPERLLVFAATRFGCEEDEAIVMCPAVNCACIACTTL